MSERKEGPFGLKLPNEYEITFKKLPDSDNWKLHYMERFDPSIISEEELKVVAQNFHKLWGIQITLSDYTISFEMTGSCAKLAAGLATEFLTRSDFGKMTLSELIIMAGFANTKVDELLREAVKQIATDAVKCPQTDYVKGKYNRSRNT